MRTLFTLFAVACLLASVVSANESQRPQEHKPTVSLKIGDLAPALKVTKWLQGDAVKRFEPGNVYVVEFWATWCSACIRHMPHLSELQARYKDAGVEIISFTSRDIRGLPNNTEEEVAAFVKRQRPPLSHAFAYADDGVTADAWLKAAGQNGFCTFVVDKTGRIAYMGHPMFLNLVLTKIMIGGASAKAVGGYMDVVVADYEIMHAGLIRDFTAGRDLKVGLRALKEFETKYPPLADMSPLVQAKLSLLPKYGDPGDGMAYAEALVAKAIEQKDVRLLSQASSILRDQKESKEFLALAIRAAHAHVRIDSEDVQALLNLSEAYLVSGDHAKAREYARRAISTAAAEPPAIRAYVEEEAQRLGAER